MSRIIKSKKNYKRRRILAVVIAAIAVLFVFILVAGIVIGLSRRPRRQNPTFDTEHYQFYMPDRDLDILTDEDYLALDRTIVYSSGAESYHLSRGDRTARPSAQIFFDYIDAIVHGDADRLNAMYTEECIRVYGAHEPFTMQQVYDTTVAYERTVIDERTGQEGDVYVLDYKIHRNDGTFRRDIDSDSTRSQVVTVIESDDGYRIADIHFYIIQ